MEILKEDTKSLCPNCYQVVPARVYVEDGQVLMIKNCPLHGEFKTLIEKDAWVYKKLMDKDPSCQRRPYENIMIDATYSCNLDCQICYLPDRIKPEPSLEDIKKAIFGFGGRYVWLSGGEPTLRKDLSEIIKLVCQKEKSPVLLTNGLKLAERDYVRELRKSGLRFVLFSFNGFDDEAYKKINGRRMLKIKLNALKNLMKEKMDIILSFMIVKGVNEKELKKTYLYYLRNFRFFNGLKIRTAVRSGKYDINLQQFYLSDIISMLSKMIGASKEELVEHFLRFSNGHHQPCQLTIKLLLLVLSGSKINKIKKVFMLLSNIGLKNILYILIKKLKGEKPLSRLYISIRVWPDKYGIDLNEMKRCRSCYSVSKTEEAVPFCYGVITNSIQ